MANNIYLGSILWVKLGPRGNFKSRPAVAISEPDSEGYLFIVAGSTKNSCDPEKEIELPWMPTRHPLTKLKKRTFIDVTWLEKIHISDIQEKPGRVPSPTLIKIQEKIREMKAPSKTNSD